MTMTEIEALREARNNPGMKVFEKGWANRMAQVKEFILGTRG